MTDRRIKARSYISLRIKKKLGYNCSISQHSRVFNILFHPQPPTITPLFKHLPTTSFKANEASGNRLDLWSLIRQWRGSSLVLGVVRVQISKLLRVNVTTLSVVDIPVNTGFPCGCTDKTQGARGSVFEDVLDFLQSLGGSLGKHEEDVNKHNSTKDAKHDVHLPGDIRKCWRHEVGKSEVECPVRASGERDGLSADAQRVQLRWVDPGDRAPLLLSQLEV